MECKHCKSSIDPNAPYCPKCGMTQTEISTKEEKISKLDNQVENHKITKNKGNNPILIVVIILIAIPTIYAFYLLVTSLTDTSNEINSKKESAVVKDAEGVISAAKDFVTEYMLETNGAWEEKHIFECNGKMCATTINGKTRKLTIQNTIPKSGSIEIDTTGKIKIKDDLVFDTYKCRNKTSDVIECKE